MVTVGDGAEIIGCCSVGLWYDGGPDTGGGCCTGGGRNVGAGEFESSIVGSGISVASPPKLI